MKIYEIKFFKHQDRIKFTEYFIERGFKVYRSDDHTISVSERTKKQ